MVPKQDVLGLKRVKNGLIKAIAVEVGWVQGGYRLHLIHSDAAEKKLIVAHKKRYGLLTVKGCCHQKFFAGNQGAGRVFFCGRRGFDCLALALAVEADGRKAFATGLDGGREFHLIDQLGIQGSDCCLLTFLVIGICGFDTLYRGRVQARDGGSEGGKRADGAQRRNSGGGQDGSGNVRVQSIHVSNLR